jgi:LPXTG-motif cell wall-anchored protein
MAFGDAVSAMQQANVPLDVALGTVQYVQDANGSKIPLHGGPGDPDGDFDAIYSSVLSGQGTDPSLGSSYVQVVTWHDGTSCPDSRTILTYSQSQDRTSPHYRDQTRLWSGKQWLDDGYCSVGNPAQLGMMSAAKASAVAPDGGTTPTSRRAAGSALPTTGASAGVPLAGAALLAAAGLLARSRRFRGSGLR